MEFVWFILIGLVAGWLAGQLVRGGGFGVIGDIVVNYSDSLLNTLIMPYCQHGSLTSYCNSRLSTSCDTTW